MSSRPEEGKTYLIVTCRGCNTGFRVMDAAVDQGKPGVDGPQRLTCRGCGHVDVYAPSDMRAAMFTNKPRG